ncbi:hypothetical protein L6452_22548 [Arctium lappa]|uniref:Uncharacterized protein n=1 Tax=Arctium lappa TaxID=4217 RepID=A0ACB9AZG8_ARCLA|nr:hypothetical protein L6452_22548 [Arctium lappa]
MDPKNLMAIEIADRVKSLMEAEKGPKSFMVTENGDKLSEEEIKALRIDEKKDEGENNGKFEKISDGNYPKKFEEKPEKIEVEPIDEDKLVVEEKIRGFNKEDEHKRSIKLVYDDDIRWAKIPFNCDVLELREVIFDRFSVSQVVLMNTRTKREIWSPLPRMKS